MEFWWSRLSKTPPKFHEKRDKKERSFGWFGGGGRTGGGGSDGGGSCRGRSCGGHTHASNTAEAKQQQQKQNKEAKQQQQSSNSKAATAKQQQQSSNSKAATAKQQQQSSNSKAATAAAGVFGALWRDPTVCWPPVCCLCLTLSFAATLSKLACLCAMHQVPQRGAHHGTRRTRTSTAQEGSYGPNSPSLRMGEQAMRKVQFPGPLKTFNSSRAAGGGGSGDHAALKKARAALAAAQDADFPQSFIDELAQEVQCRRKEREQKKTIGARLDSASAAWEKARAKYQEAEAGVAAAADTLDNTLEADKVLREQARTECVKEDNETENRMTAVESTRHSATCSTVWRRHGRPEPRPQLGFKKQCP